MRLTFIIYNLTVEPLGVMTLISEARNKGFECDVYKYINDWQLFEYLKEYEPDVVAFSLTTGQHIKLFEIAKTIKEFKNDIKIIVGGSHITYFPESAEKDYIDYYVRGEADNSFINLLSELKHGNIVKKKDCSQLYLPLDLDSIPFPDRELVYKYSEFKNNMMRNVMTSRGCPYNCSYCYNSVYREIYKGQKIVRHRSISNIVEECLELKNNYDTKMIFFADDEFSRDINRLREFRDLYSYKVKLPFHCQIRIDSLDRERVQILKQAGCYSLTFAIESGDEQLRKKLLNRNVTDENIINGCKLLREYKIKFRAENMIGIPTESFDSMMKTLDLNIKVRPDYAWCSIYQPYPNTILGEYCKENNLFDGDSQNIKERFTEDTALDFTKEDRLVLINLQRLFAIIVRFRFLRDFVYFLIPLSLTKQYTYLRNVWKKICYKKLFKGI